VTMYQTDWAISSLQVRVEPATAGADSQSDGGDSDSSGVAGGASALADVRGVQQGDSGPAPESLGGGGAAMSQTSLAAPLAASDTFGGEAGGADAQKLMLPMVGQCRLTNITPRVETAYASSA